MAGSGARRRVRGAQTGPSEGTRVGMWERAQRRVVKPTGVDIECLRMPNDVRTSVDWRAVQLPFPAGVSDEAVSLPPSLPGLIGLIG